MITSCSESNTVSEDCVLTEKEKAIISELDLLVHPFNSISFDGVNSELEPLIDYLAEAQIVGLGEATHGTTEFYHFKNLLFRKLAEDEGFKAIIFEIPWGNALIINDFVTKGIGSADLVVNQSYYWTYDTEEVRELVHWIHDYNLNLPASEKIYFVGCDPQGNSFKEEIEVIKKFLEKTLPEATSEIVSYYSELPSTNLYEYPNQTDVHKANEDGVKNAHQFFIDKRETLLANSSNLEYEVAFMATHVIMKREELYRTSEFGESRDKLMAEYTEWWYNILDSKVAVWAHNNHVLNGTPLNQGRMGTFLKRTFRDDYLIVGFSFSAGSFNAVLADESFNPVGNLGAQLIESPLCGSVNYLLNEVVSERHFIIFDELSGESGDYFYEYHRFTQFGSFFNPTYIKNYSNELPLRSIMDVIVHYDLTTESILK